MSEGVGMHRRINRRVMAPWFVSSGVLVVIGSMALHRRGFLGVSSLQKKKKHSYGWKWNLCVSWLQK